MSAVARSNTPPLKTNPEVGDYCEIILEQDVIFKDKETSITCVFRELYDWAKISV